MTALVSRARSFLFPVDAGTWLGLLRVGLGLQLIFYAWSLRDDWLYLYGSKGHGLVSRALDEAILAGGSGLTPRLGWFIAAGQHLGCSEAGMLSLLWWGLLLAGLFLLLGIFSRPAAIAGWFLYLSSVKSGLLFSYGVDNFTTIGLFYLMIAPLADAWSLDWKWRGRRAAQPSRLGFHRRVLQLHLCLIYFFGGLSKALGPEWWSGVSVWRALTRPPFDLIPADSLIHFSFLLPFIGISVCLLETVYPIFIWPRRTRSFWLTAILLMHLSIGLAMGLYLFALIMIVLNLAAFGPEYLALLKKKRFSPPLSAIMAKPG